MIALVLICTWLYVGTEDLVWLIDLRCAVYLNKACIRCEHGTCSNMRFSGMFSWVPCLLVAGWFSYVPV
jgi:hypothetical protein